MIYNFDMFINGKFLKKVFFVFLLFNSVCFCFSETVWTINKANGKKAGKVFKGDFTTINEAIANWIYYGLKDKKGYCIALNSSYTTNTPSTYYRTIYNVVLEEFQSDRDGAISKYNIELNAKIEKKEAKRLRSLQKKLPENQNEADLSDTVSQIAVDSESTEKTDESEINQNQSTLPPPVENDEEKIEKERLEKEELERKEQEKKEQEALIQAIESAIQAPTVKFKEKQYLQDYMVSEEKEFENEPLLNYDKFSDPDERDTFGQTLLMKAARAGNDWKVKNLLNQGANVNLKDNDGWTALMYAVRYQENLSTVNLLLDAKADVKLKNNFDSSALIIAVSYNNNPEVIKKLLDYYIISEKEVLKSFTLLLSSQTSEYAQLAKIKVFLNKSIPLNSFYDGKTPLMYASQYGNSTKVIKLLLDNNCITTLRSTEGKTAFDYASENKNLNKDNYYWMLNKK